MDSKQMSPAPPEAPEAATPADWPAFGLKTDVRPELARALSEGRPTALVTLFAAEGPAPHGMGAQMLLGEGVAAGFLSGGCIEADVAIHAARTVADGAPRRLVYGRGGPPDIRLLCGARIELLVERVAPDDPAAARLLALTDARAPALWLTDGRARACLAEDEAPDALPDGLRLAYERALAVAAVAAPALESDAVYRRYDPQPRVVVAGGDPTALAMATLALKLGWAAAIVRPKGPAVQPPVLGAAYLRGPATDALGSMRLDAWTAVAATSHDIEADSDILAAALPSQAAYIGVLGSRRRIPERLAALRAMGLSEAVLSRLHAPIGLAIGAEGPWEIALAALAEMTAVFKARRAERLWRGQAS